jgi:2-methylcitrate dehydratase PrpD
LLSGHFDETNYVPATQPEFCRLAQRIVIKVDDKLSRAYPARQGAEVLVRTVDGRRLSRQLANVAPANAANVTDRFLAAAESRFGPERAAALSATIDSLETLADAGRLVAACAA